MQQMVEFAINPKALVFIKLDPVGKTDFYILTEKPLWLDSREYVVRDDLTLSEAIEDRTETLARLQEARTAQETLEQYG
tara:strand:- start:5910 stop:6146 length:237 start_codon:yes stop_codon:yes gene_type:complete